VRATFQSYKINFFLSTFKCTSSLVKSAKSKPKCTIIEYENKSKAFSQTLLNPFEFFFFFLYNPNLTIAFFKYISIASKLQVKKILQWTNKSYTTGEPLYGSITDSFTKLKL
jgi:hypothetical protein